MKKPVLILSSAACLFIATSINAHAQGNFGGPPGGGQPPGANQQQDPQMAADRKAEEELELKDRKSEMELKIANQMSELEKHKSCIEGATTMQALHSCMPGGGPGGMQGSPGGRMTGAPGGMQGGQGGGMRPPPGGMMGGPGGMGGQGPQ